MKSDLPKYLHEYLHKIEENTVEYYNKFQDKVKNTENFIKFDEFESSMNELKSKNEKNFLDLNMKMLSDIKEEYIILKKRGNYWEKI